MVSNYHTHPILDKLTKNCSIHIHLITRSNWSYLGFLHVALWLGDRVTCNLKFIQQHPSFLHYQSCRLPWTPMSNYISIMPHTPCNHEEHLQNIIPHMLEKYKIPHHIHKFIILDSMSFETNARLDPNFMSSLTLPKKMTTSFFTQPTCFTYIIINNLPMTQVHLRGNDISAYLPRKRFHFIR